MKVLLFSNLFPSPQEPTRGTFTFQTATALARHCEVRVVAPLPWWTRARRPAELFAVPRDASRGIEAAFPTYWTIPRFGHALHGRAMYASLRGYVARLRREYAFDAILASWAYPDAFAAARIADDLGCPVVTSLLGSDINDLAARPALREQIRWCLLRSRRVVTVSGALRERVLELGVPGDRVLVQHNGVDGGAFTIRDRREVRARLGLPADRKIVCYVGNFKPEKGVDVLIEAMGRLRADDIELALVGSGPLEERMRARVAELGLEGRVRFCGRRLHAEIPLWISAGDVFCLPSRREGCPNVVLEALASGRPVVASRVGGVPELLGRDNGVLVPSEDPGALADGLRAALGREWSPEALRGTVGCLSWDDVGRTYHDVLAAALKT